MILEAGDRQRQKTMGNIGSARKKVYSRLMTLGKLCYLPNVLTFVVVGVIEFFQESSGVQKALGGVDQFKVQLRHRQRPVISPLRPPF
ncbi:hypothetical protein Gura_1469 [Geotalea uraniireducens Rf4]|uniref:Uncharacterized protein n=1 Tax=Geotalea uraniireducens (strain Rf4) TaxID=351605 RepID=A5GE13_GEOUR|nr:hypothetical protein Gura_1469 [Geotalea uraniireducens Rf4]